MVELQLVAEQIGVCGGHGVDDKIGLEQGIATQTGMGIGAIGVCQQSGRHVDVCRHVHVLTLLVEQTDAARRRACQCHHFLQKNRHGVFV